MEFLNIATDFGYAYTWHKQVYKIKNYDLVNMMYEKSMRPGSVPVFFRGRGEKK